MDEHVPKAVVDGMRLRGVEVLTTQGAGMCSATDIEQLTFAEKNNMVFFTQDADFLRIHDGGVQHSGIVYAPQQTPIGAMVHGLILVCHVLETGDMLNHVEFI